MMSIRSLADFNGSSLGGDSDWLIPPPSPPRPQTPGRHGERGMGTFNWPPARTSTWPLPRTFSWPRTNVGLLVKAVLKRLGATPVPAIAHEALALVRLHTGRSSPSVPFVLPEVLE